MTRRDWLPWLLLGFVLGFILAVYLLSNMQPESPQPCADAQPVDDLHNADFRNEASA